jgi:pimeloyl-ACP methyl ester carboxylesterase
MMRDIVEVWKALFASSSSSSERVPTLLVGHSMGGALAVWAAATKEIAGLDGVVVIDVVEGTALGKWWPFCVMLNCRACMSAVMSVVSLCSYLQTCVLVRTLACSGTSPGDR